jgi:hypothetical protein
MSNNAYQASISNIRALVARVKIVHELMSTRLNKNSLMTNIEKYKKDIINDPESKGLLEKLENIGGEEFKNLEKMLNFAITNVIKKKWENNINLRLKKWADKEATVCRTDGNNRYHSTSFVVDTMFSGAGNRNIDIVGMVETLGFALPTLRAALEYTANDINKNDYCKSSRDNGSSSSSSIRPWGRIVEKAGLAFQDIVSELQPVFDFIKIMSTQSPMSILNDPEKNLGNGLILETVLRNMFNNEPELTSKGYVLPDLNDIRKRFGDDAIIDIIPDIKLEESASKIDSLVRSVVRKPGYVSKKDKQSTAMEELYKRIDKSLTDVVSSARLCSTSISPSTPINEMMRLVSDVMSKATSLLREVQRIPDSVAGASPSANAGGVSGSSSGFGGKSSGSAWLPESSGRGFSSSAVMNPRSSHHLRGESAPDITYMDMNATLCEQHLRSLKAYDLVKDVVVTRDNALLIINDLVRRSDSPSCNRLELRQSIEQALRTYMRQVKRIFYRYVAKQREFVTMSNRRSLQYMRKWKAVWESQKEGDTITLQKQHTELIDKYFEQLAMIADWIDEVTLNAEGEALKLFTSAGFMTIVGEDEVMVEKVQSQVEDFESYLIQKRRELLRMYSASGYSIADVFRDTSFIIVYIVKGLRIFFIWCALIFARAFFQARFNDIVYVQNKLPPHPAWFVLIFLAFDLGLNVSLYVMFKTLMFLFKSKDTDFPINATVMRLIVLDYVISTALIAVLAIFLAVVIRRRKYFRYRYEGDRGIRALSDMILWTSAALMIIPFFKFLDS